MNECPPIAQLRFLLVGRLAEEDEKPLELHLEKCSTCQQLLERLTDPSPRQLDDSSAENGFDAGSSTDTDRLDNAFNETSVHGLSSVTSGDSESSDSDPYEKGNAKESQIDYRQLRSILPPMELIEESNVEGLPSIAGYELKSQLGRGGMGVVYAARDIRLDRLVAVKLLNRSAGSHLEDTIRFRSEAQTIAQLQHPNIVQLYEFGSDARVSYYILELVDGGNLSEKLEGKPQSPAAAAKTVQTIARAIHYAHSKGIVHRDLKPSNILLQRNENEEEIGEPKISDFGLAKLLDTDLQLTRTGEMAGTPSYMSPEQIRGDTRQIGPATDVYSLGVILYELLVGRPPFLAATALETIQKAANDEPVDPSVLEPGLSCDITTICLKCLQKEGARRYSTAEELADDLQRFLENKPIRARQISRGEKFARWARRNPVIAGLSATLAVALMAATTIVSISLWRMSIALESSEAAQSQTVEAEREAKDRLWQSYLSRARAARFSRRSGQRVGSLEALNEAAKIAVELNIPESKRLALRNEAVACLSLCDMTLEKEWATNRLINHGLAFDASNSRFAFALPDRGFAIYNVDDGQETEMMGSDAEFGSLRFSPNGLFLAGTKIGSQSKNRSGVVWDSRSRKQVLEVSNVSNEAAIAFTSDSKTVAFGLTTREVACFDMKGKMQSRFPVPQTPSCLAMDSKARRLAVSTDNSQRVHVFDFSNGKLLAHYKQEANVACLDWEPRGDTLAVGCFDNRTYLWDTKWNRLRSELEGHQSAVVQVSFHPREQLLATQSWDGTTRLWDPVDGSQLVNASTMWANQWSSDGKYLAGGAGGKFQRWQIPDGANCRILHHGNVGNRSSFAHSNGPWSAEFSADDRLIASASFDGVRLWDASTGAELAFLRMGSCVSAIFQPDGALITHADGKLQRWPIRSAKGGDRLSLKLGPPVQLSVPAGTKMAGGRISQDATGEWLALCERGGNEAIVWKRDSPTEHLKIETPGVTDVALSPDARFVAVSTWNESNFEVWDLRQRKRSMQLDDKNGFAAFSPDSQLLVVGTPQEFKIWNVNEWSKPVCILPRAVGLLRGHAAFSKDGRFLAIAHSNQSAKLMDTESWKELATFEAPGNHLISGLSLTANADKLAVATESHIIQLWNLRSLRTQLAKIDLDWSSPKLQPVDSKDDIEISIAVEQSTNAPVKAVDSWSVSVADATRSIQLEPDNAELFYSRAILFMQKRRLEEALHDFEKACQLQASSRHYEALGWAYVCLGRSQDGVSQFQHALDWKSADDWDIYRRAIVRFALGEKDLFRADSRMLFERHQFNNDPWLTDRATKLSLLESKVQLDQNMIYRMATRASKAEPNVCWFPLVQGFAEYRLEKYEDSVDSLNRALSVFRTKDQYADATILFVRAMSQFRLHRADEAKRTFKKATEIFEAYLSALDDSPGKNWHDWLLCEIVRREAESLLMRTEIP